LLGDSDLLRALAPEFVIVIGIVLMMLVPNLGNATFRLPVTNLRIPFFLGGKRFSWSSHPRVPAMIALVTLLTALAAAAMSQMATPITGLSHEVCVLSSGVVVEDDCGISSTVDMMLRMDGYSRLFEMLFYGAMILALAATMHRIPGVDPEKIPEDRFKDEKREGIRIQALLNNRRQVDFFLLLLMAALGMSLVAIAMDLFVLFVGLELASLSTYVLVAFLKEEDAGSEAGVKYFIVGSVSSAVGLYGLSLLFLWSGSVIPGADPTLSLAGPEGLVASWAAMGADLDALAVAGLAFFMVALCFKISAVPFHFATPDAYAGAAGQIAGVLATASKAMGFLVLLRVLVVMAAGGSAEAVWLPVIGILAALTMTWGNLAALSSRNPKRMLAYSSIAHAGYMLAALAALGLGTEESSAASKLLLTAIIFHLCVLVTFKLGAFLVIALLEMRGGGTRLEDLHGLARRDPLIAVAMCLFMLALAGVPPLAGFLSKLLMVSGIFQATVSDSVSFSNFSGAFESLHWVFWLAVLIFINSAISLFYYLRLVVVMFYEPAEGSGGRLPNAAFLRIAIISCALGVVIFGFGAFSDHLLILAKNAAETLL
jgi:NADH-quinone oxidoreductase subunit N